MATQIINKNNLFSRIVELFHQLFLADVWIYKIQAGASAVKEFSMILFLLSFSSEKYYRFKMLKN